MPLEEDALSSYLAPVLQWSLAGLGRLTYLRSISLMEVIAACGVEKGVAKQVQLNL